MSCPSPSLRSAVRPLVVVAACMLLPLAAAAHDPYEITATASLQSNRLDLHLVLEFSTAMQLAGVMSPRPPEVTATNWFHAHRAALLACARAFCEVQAGETRLPVRDTAVALSVEDHVEFQVEYAPPTARPLRFNAVGLQPLAGQGPYGVGLTVLDLVGKKVIGQAVLFASVPAATVGAAAPPPITDSSPLPATTALTLTNGLVASALSPPAAPAPAPLTASKLVGSAIFAILAALLLVLFACRHQRFNRANPKP